MSTVKLFKPCKGTVKILIFDIEDFAKLNRLGIRLTKQSATYYRVKTNKNTMISHILCPCPPHLVVDHINRNSLDNRKSNLRLATKRENSANRTMTGKPNKASKYKGVYKRNDTFRSKPWEAAIWEDYKCIARKSFHTEKEAALQYNEWALECYGNFAVLNEVKND